MKDRERMEQINTLMSGLKQGIGKSKFVGIIIQMIGICKINHFKREEIFELFQKALFEAEFAENQNHDYLAVYINQLNHNKKDTFELEQFEQKMFGLIQCPDYEAIALADEAEYALYEQEEEDNAGDTGVLDGSFWESERPVTIAENLQAGFGNIPKKKEELPGIPYLIRESSGEEIPLKKEIFVIGKDADSVDYVIYGNTTVSRKHAEIIKRGRHYFICDKGSTNKTYVEGKEIRPEEFVEIHNGTRIKISNEEFTFHL